MTTPNVFLEFIERYGPKAKEEGPVLFVREVLGPTPDPWQEDVLRAFGRGERRISIRSCHGPGKTAVASWIVLVQLITRFPQKTIATAPTSAQLFDALFAEVMTWFNTLPEAIKGLFNATSNRIELIAAPDESFFSARTSRAEKPEALQGVHSEHVLLIADEASGIPEQIFEAAVGSMSGHSATTLLLSNPVRTSGFFFDTHHKLSDMWYTKHVSHSDSPRVSADFVHDVSRRYGEDSNAFRVRCLGEFPLADDDTVIPFELIESARNRDITTFAHAPTVWGLDVSRFGSDTSVLVKRKGKVVLDDIKTWHKLDLMQLCGRVHNEYTSAPERPSEILVDVIGLGSGVVDRLRELNLPVRGINVGEAASANDKYRNLRSELWFKAREWLDARDCKLPNHEQLCEELAVPKYTFMSSGKIAVEPKADIKKRGFASPNHADAFLLTLASTPASFVSGQGRRSWNEPVKMNRKGIV